MPTAYKSNAPSRHKAVLAQLPLLDGNPQDTHIMKTDAFGTTATPPSAPTVAAPATAPVPGPAVAAPAAPKPAPPASSPQANAAPPVLNSAVGAAPAPAAPQPTTNANPAPAAPAQTGHMPKVGTVTADNPTGDPSKDPALTNGLDEKKEALKAQVANLGKVAGAGANSITELAILVCQASKDGIISAKSNSDPAKDDVTQLFTAFRTSLHNARVDRVDEKEFKDKVQISKLRVFAKLGAIETKSDASKMLTRARDLIGKAKDIKGSTYTHLITIAREQIKVFAAAKDGKGKLLTDAQIKDLLAPEGEKETLEGEAYELSELEAIMKRLVKLSGGTENDGGRPPHDAPEYVKAYEVLNGRKLALVAKMPKAE